MTFRHAMEKDITKILDLLVQVLDLHCNLRPDLFIKGKTKYDRTQLLSIINDNNKPVYVAVESDIVVGYCFCIIKDNVADSHIKNHKTLYIDDLCIDSNYRHKHIGKQLLEYVIDEAKKIGIEYITLNVWEGNDTAKLFYEYNGFKPRKTEMELNL